MTWLRRPNAFSKLSTTSFVNVAMPHSRGGNDPMNSVRGGTGGNTGARYCKQLPRKAGPRALTIYPWQTCYKQKDIFTVAPAQRQFCATRGEGRPRLRFPHRVRLR